MQRGAGGSRCIAAAHASDCTKPAQAHQIAAWYRLGFNPGNANKCPQRLASHAGPSDRPTTTLAPSVAIALFIDPHLYPGLCDAEQVERVIAEAAAMNELNRVGLPATDAWIAARRARLASPLSATKHHLRFEHHPRRIHRPARGHTTAPSQHLGVPDTPGRSTVMYHCWVGTGIMWRARCLVTRPRPPAAEPKPPEVEGPPRVLCTTP